MKKEEMINQKMKNTKRFSNIQISTYNFIQNLVLNYRPVASLSPVIFGLVLDIVEKGFSTSLIRTTINTIPLTILLNILYTLLEVSKNENEFYEIQENTYRNKIIDNLSLPDHLIKEGYKIKQAEKCKSLTDDSRCIEKFAYSEPINLAMYTGNLNPEIVKSGKYSLFETLKNIQTVVLIKFKNMDTIVINNDLTRLANELYLDTDKVFIQKAKYFDYVSSNGICFNKYKSNKENGYYLKGEDLWLDKVDQAYEIQDLSQSSLANLIGVSSLLVTSDQHIILLVQSHGAEINQGKAVPSGSGSSDYKDLKCLEKRNKGKLYLNDLLTYGMEREIVEEVGIDQELVGKEVLLETSVLGYAKICERGCKPDFFGLTHTNKDLAYFKDFLYTGQYVKDASHEIISGKYKAIEFKDMDDLIENLEKEEERASVQISIFIELLKTIKKSNKDQELLKNPLEENKSPKGRRK